MALRREEVQKQAGEFIQVLTFYEFALGERRNESCLENWEVEIGYKESLRQIVFNGILEQEQKMYSVTVNAESLELK